MSKALFVISLLFLSGVTGSKTKSVSVAGVAPGNRIHHLHKLLDISGPNQDIRTNVFLNMEGL